MGQLFLPLLGNWTGLEKQEASPWAPATTARASFVFKLDVAGTVVVQDYRQVRADGAEFLGTACSWPSPRPGVCSGGSSTPPRSRRSRLPARGRTPSWSARR